jgi:tetratricopeptide (TPR) repeat protein
MLMGHYADAVVYYDKCLEYSGDQNDDEPEFVMSVMKNEVTCYEQLKEWNKAAGLYAKMIQWWESKDANSKSVKQKSRAERADLLDRMAACYMQLGDYDEAVKCLERAYAKRKKHRPSHNNNSNNYKEWHTLFHLAECLRQLNKTSEALLVLAKCRKRIGGGKRSSKEKGEEGVSHHHPRMADTHNATGLTLFKKGEWKSALGEFEQALLIYRRVYSHNHKDVAAVVSNMGRCHDKLNAAASSSRPP